MNLRDLLHMMIQKKASDLHLKEGRPPIMRIDGRLTPLDMEILSNGDMREIIYSLTDEKTRKKFDETNEMDLAYNLEGVARFRANAFKQMGKLEAVLRAIPVKIPSLEEINMPSVLKEIALFPRGLVLVTGTTGSGKSTTLAAMINAINETYNHHIVTIEDPIEFVHTDKKCSITQREVGLDTESFATALRYVLRQDPDVILIGEMRDAITVGTAISAAETGHMVFSTLHTMDTVQTINRILDFFPKEQQAQVRIQLAGALKAVISLRLVEKITGGRVPAAEIMVATSTVKGYIEEGKLGAIRDLIKDGEKDGMQTFDQSLIKLYKQGLITVEDAKRNATSPQEIDLAMKGITTSKASAQSILDTMMKEQNQKEVKAELQKGKSLLSQNKFQEAYELYEKLMGKYPDLKEAQDGINIAKKNLNSEAFAQNIKNILAEGLNIYKKGNIQGAIVKWQEGLQMDPTNQQLANYIKSAEENMKLAAMIPGMINEGVEIYKTGRVEDAIAKWGEVLKLDANNAQAKGYIASAQQKLAELKEKKEMENSMAAASAALAAGSYMEAMMLFKHIYEAKPGNVEAQKGFETARAKLMSESFGSDVEAEIANEAFRKSIDMVVAENYFEALKELKKAAEKRPLDKKLKDHMERVKATLKARLESLMAKVDEAYRVRNIFLAIENANRILFIDPSNEFALKYVRDIKPLIEAETDKMYKQAVEMITTARNKEAKALLESIIKVDPSHVSAAKRLAEVNESLKGQ